MPTCWASEFYNATAKKSARLFAENSAQFESGAPLKGTLEG
jgi:hypothetical protein